MTNNNALQDIQQDVSQNGKTVFAPRILAQMLVSFIEYYSYLERREQWSLYGCNKRMSMFKVVVITSQYVDKLHFMYNNLRVQEFMGQTVHTISILAQPYSQDGDSFLL